MKKIFILLLWCVCCHGGFAQGNRSFYAMPKTPISGEEITLVYKNALTELASSNQIRGVIYLCDGDAWSVDDLEMVNRDTAWMATYRLPEDCVMFACKFHGEDGKWDSGKRMSHYGVFVSQRVGEETKLQHGAHVHWGFLRHKTFEAYAVQGFSAEEDQIEDNVMQYWINNEFRYFPESRETLSYFAAKLLDKMAPGKHNHLFVQDLDYIVQLAAPAELSLIRVAEIYKTIIKDEAKSKEVEAVILERFPNGILARDREIWRMFQLKDTVEKETALVAFMKRFPAEKFGKTITETYRSFYTKVVWAVIQHQVEKQNKYDLFYEYLPVVPFSVLSEYYYRLVQLPLKHKIKSYNELLPASEAIYNEFLCRAERGEDPLYAATFRKRFSPREWKQQVFSRCDGFFYTHADILYHTGNPVKAMELLEIVKEPYQGKSSDCNDLYMKLLIANGYTQMVVPYIEASIQWDAATPDMLDVLRKAFLEKNPSGDFDAYLNGLRADEFVAQKEEKLKKSLIKKEIEPFVLEDMQGNIVDMSQLKGKVIVLDFWATWCSPCKAALPGMQMAVNHFKNNPNVQFYFISTLEYDKNYKTTIPKFLKEMNYSLEVLYDNVNPATGKNDVIYNKYSKAFGVNGIPHKMIIDGDGYLRWSSGGYAGNPMGLATEIGFLVDYLLNEKKGN